MGDRPVWPKDGTMSRRTRMRCASAVQVAGVSMFLGWTAVSPPPAAAQLSLGSLVGNITAPASGCTVSGTVTVTASVTIVGALTVRDVQFQLDGANLGAADTSAPYSIPW